VQHTVYEGDVYSGAGTSDTEFIDDGSFGVSAILMTQIVLEGIADVTIMHDHACNP